MASALAALGQTQEADAILQGLAANDVQYAGRPSAVMGPLLASKGDFAAAMETAESFMARYKNALRELAK